ncbi:MAG: CBS domain-containing protein [Candidatus Methylomirabilales bacterium]
MTKRVVGVSRDVSIAKVVDIMVRNNIGCLPVLEWEMVVGITTESDILRARGIRGDRLTRGGK